MKTFSLLLAAVLLGYLGVTFSPTYIDHVDVIQAIRNAAVSARQLPENMIRDRLISQLNQVGSHFEETAQGESVERHGLGLTANDVVVHVDPKTKEYQISVSYQRRVRLVPTNRFVTIDFSPHREGTGGD